MIARLLRAWLSTTVADGLFSSALSALAYGSTVLALWQGVGTTAFGAGAFGGGTSLAAAGLLVHAGVALAWSIVFLAAYQNSAAIRRTTRTWFGVAKAAAVYGPLIWVVMSMVVIRAATGRAPALTLRWWVQFFGHAVFVGLPIVAGIRARPGGPATADAG